MNDHALVMAAEFWQGSTGMGLAAGLRRIGWDVEGVDYRNHFSAQPTLATKLLARAGRPFAIAGFEAALMKAVAETDARVFLTTKGPLLSPQFLGALKRRGVLLVNFYPDVYFTHAGLSEETFPLYDLFITTKSFQLETLNRMLGPERVRFVHHGYVPFVHRPRVESLNEADMTADIAYIGNHSPYKDKWMQAVARAFPEARIVVHGARWKEAARGTPLEPFVSGKQMHGDFYARAIQASRINLSLHFAAPDAKGWGDRVSTRTFEIPACRGFMLHIDNDEVRGLFAPGEEIGVFADEDALCACIAHYLQHPEERAAMIEKAWRRCVPAYSYDARAEEVSTHIRALLAARA